jgi:hypothetical protein
MKPIKEVVTRLVNPIVKKRGIVHAKIIFEWERVVGEKYASFSRPLKIYFRPGQRSQGTLHMAVSPSHALLVIHSKDLVIDRINTYFGYNAIQDLKIFQQSV